MCASLRLFASHLYPRLLLIQDDTILLKEGRRVEYSSEGHLCAHCQGSSQLGDSSDGQDGGLKGPEGGKPARLARKAEFVQGHSDPTVKNVLVSPEFLGQRVILALWKNK